MLRRDHTCNVTHLRENCLAASARRARLSSTTGNHVVPVIHRWQQPQCNLAAAAAAASEPLQPRPLRPAQRSPPPSPTSETLGASAVPAPSPGASDRYQDRFPDTVAPRSGASPLVKAINQQIMAARDLDEVRHIYNTYASQFDTVCLATVRPLRQRGHLDVGQA